MNGKSRCKILKEIRRQIAESNDITFVTSECKYQGDCKGTCPKCEAEVRYLEQELEKRRKQGLSITLAGIATAVTLTAAGCFRPVESETGGPKEATSEESVSEDLTGEMGALIESDTEMGELESDPVIYDGVMIDVPRICNLPGMTAEEQLDYVSMLPASMLRDSYWQDEWVETRHESQDIYEFEWNGGRYVVIIFFDEGDMITRVSLILAANTGETGTDTETDTIIEVGSGIGTETETVTEKAEETGAWPWKRPRSSPSSATASPPTAWE